MEISEVGITLIVGLFILLAATIFRLISRVIDNGFGFVSALLSLTGIIVGFIFVAKSIVGIVEFGGLTITHETEAEVKAVGYQGIVIEFVNGYGEQTEKETVKIKNTEKYDEGETVTISITKYALFNDPIIIVKDDK